MFDGGGVVDVGCDQPLKLTAAWARQGLLSLPATLPGKAPGGVHDEASGGTFGKPSSTPNRPMKSSQI